MVTLDFMKEATQDSMLLSWAAITAAETGTSVVEVLRALHSTVTEEILGSQIG